MCELTAIEEAILRGLREKEKSLLASQLRIKVATIDVHLTRIRRKRAKCKRFLNITSHFKKELYPKRRGE